MLKTPMPTEANYDVRMAIKNAGLRYYQVAERMNVATYTFTHWLQRELPEEKKKQILDALKD